jgi:hypothetical protein
VREARFLTNRARPEQVIGLAMFIALAITLSGCIKVDYEVSTEVRPSGACEREMKMEAASGLLVYLNITDMRSRLQTGGWKFEQRKSGNEVSLALSKGFDSVQKMAEEALGTMPIDVPLVKEGDILQPGTADLEVRNLFFVAYYKYTETTPKIALKVQRGPISVGVRKLAARLMKAEVALTLPGKITETNGKLDGASTATWELTLPDYLDGYTMTAESKIVHEWAFAVVGVGILALILVLVTLTRARRKAPKEATHGGETEDGE